jgi:hypothetical protein
MKYVDDPVVVTNTSAGLSNREIAIEVIADKLGVARAEVNDSTKLGDVAHDITMVLCFKTGKMFIGRANMTAKDVFDQL